MQDGETRTYLKALGLGAIAGMRSMAAPALFSHHLAGSGAPAGPGSLDGSPLEVLGTRDAAALLKVAAAGEMVADKTPFVPDRISPPALVVRALSGAVVGAAVCEAEGVRPDAGAVVGSLAALAGAFGMYYLRRSLGRETGIPDPVLGLVEDALVVTAGLKLLRA